MVYNTILGYIWKAYIVPTIPYPWFNDSTAAKNAGGLFITISKELPHLHMIFSSMNWPNLAADFNLSPLASSQQIRGSLADTTYLCPFNIAPIFMISMLIFWNGLGVNISIGGIWNGSSCLTWHKQQVWHTKLCLYQVLATETVLQLEPWLLEQAAQRSGVNSEKLLYWDVRTENIPGVNSEKLRTQVYTTLLIYCVSVSRWVSIMNDQ